MSFLQPFLLAALPIALLPIVIHLINQRRYQTVKWAAMMFLLAANRMSRGYARLRQWLILAFRMLALAALIFAISRPLAGGWLGFAGGGKADATIILLDRSPSMQQGGAGSDGSKLDSGRRQLARTFETLGSSRWVSIEGMANRPREFESVADLLSSTGVGPTSAPADIPGMIEAARDYIKANNPGRTEVWICSDVRRNDWDAESGRWAEVRRSLLGLPQGVRFHLLAYARTAPENLSVRVTDVHRRKAGTVEELLVSLRVARDGGDGPRLAVPIQFEIGGARSEVKVDLAGAQFDLKDHRIALEPGRGRGWGRVSIPADANPADNDSYFAFDEPAPRRAIVVAEDAQVARPLELAAAIAPDPSLKCSAEVVAIDALATVDWAGVSLLLWQGPMPSGDAAGQVQALLDRGGRAIFFPPRSPGPGDFLGVRWTTWTGTSEPVPVETWRGDSDLLALTRSGAALPVGAIEVRRRCGLEGEVTPLATLKGGAPLLARATAGAYFCATTPAPADSSLSVNGVVLYALVHRAMAAGATHLESTRQVDAGTPVSPGDDPAQWKKLAGPEETISTDYPIHRGVYESGNRLIAINRPAAEDGALPLADDRVASLFKGLDFARVDDREGSAGSLIREVWRMFLVSMMMAMVVEAGLCLPKPARPVAGAS